MALDNYCFCYGLDVGVTLVGFLHLNAALYFWARVSTFEPIYMWVDILIAACYSIRATYFFLMLNNDADAKSRKEYSDWNNWTAYGLGGCGLTIITLKWIEWAYPPTWTLVAWTLVALFNWYHWVLLSDYANAATATAGAKIEMAEAGEEDEDEAE